MRLVSHRNAKAKFIALLFCAVILCTGCTGPSLVSRVVQEDASHLVRLDSRSDAGGSSVRYDHPASWTIEDLSALLSRVLLEERVGFMDKARPPHPVFSAEEIISLAPAIRNSFQKAEPNEWISFLLSKPTGSGAAVTSGGFFLAGSGFHMVVANHRTPVATGSKEMVRLRANPFYSVQGSGGNLTFESQRFVIATQPNWWGGYRASASELVLDHQAFFSSLKLSGGAPTTSMNFTPSAIVGGDSHGIIPHLQEEIERLKQKVADLETEVDRLKSSLGQLPRGTPRQ